MAPSKKTATATAPVVDVPPADPKAEVVDSSAVVEGEAPVGAKKHRRASSSAVADVYKPEELSMFLVSLNPAGWSLG